jgi:hypothetical protein
MSITDIVLNSHPADLTGHSLVYLPMHVAIGVVRDSLLSKPSNLPYNQTDVKRILTAGGIGRSTNDIKVSSHYETCHSIYIT